MTVIARFEVIPVHDDSLSDDIAQAIDALGDHESETASPGPADRRTSRPNHPLCRARIRSTRT